MTARLALTDLGVTLGGTPVVQGLSLDLPAGALVALIGPNGAGKTTLLRAMAGLLPVTGAVMLEGRPLAAFSRHERARTIAYLPQGHQAHWPLPARDIVALGRHPHGAADPSRLAPEDRAAVESAMARTGCLALADRPVTSLSGGEKARVMLARVLAVQARVLLADEPTAALDPRHQLGVMRDLREEARSGALVVAVTHDLTLAARFADRIVLMKAGSVVAHGTPADALTEELIASVYGVTALRRNIDGAPLVVPWEVMP